jgi:hypothetical protein
LQQVNNQLVHNFLFQQDTMPFIFLSELLDLFVAGRDKSAAISQSTWLKVTPYCKYYSWTGHWHVGSAASRSYVYARPLHAAHIAETHV